MYCIICGRKQRDGAIINRNSRECAKGSGCKIGQSPEEIRSARRKQSKQHPPDPDPHNGWEAMGMGDPADW